MNDLLLTTIVRAQPNAKPLAMTLVEAAAKQGVSMEELSTACVLAQKAYQKAMDRSHIAVTEFESDAKAALERI